MFCNLDELITLLLCFFFTLHHRQKILLDSVQPFSFHTPKCPVRVMGLLPAVLSFREGISSYDYCQGRSFQECFQSLTHCFGDQSPSKATVFRWFRQFTSGARTLEDDDRCGRMATTVTPEIVSRVESLLKKGPKIIYAAIQNIMKISSGSLTRILHDCLGVRKRCVRWVPHNLSEEQKRGRVDWCTHMLRQFD